jgi:hypothetical protein
MAAAKQSSSATMASGQSWESPRLVRTASVVDVTSFLLAKTNLENMEAYIRFLRYVFAESGKLGSLVEFKIILSLLRVLQKLSLKA